MNASAAAAARLPLTASAPCILINPRSFAASRAGLAERAAALARAYGADVVMAGDSAQIDAATHELHLAGRKLVIVLAGDGTVRAVAASLTSGPADLPLPVLLLLKGGRSNIIAADFGSANGALTQLERVLRHVRDGGALVAKERHLLEITQAGDQPRLGFCLAAGLLDYAMRACHRDRLRDRGPHPRGTAGTAWSVGKVLLNAMRGALDSRLDDLRVEVRDGEQLARSAHFLLVSTLQTRQGLLDPFAERGRGALRFTAISARGLGFWARLPLVAAGRFLTSMDTANGYLSGRCEALLLHRLSQYTLDGEEYDADPALPVVIRRGPQLKFASL